MVRQLDLAVRSSHRQRSQRLCCCGWALCLVRLPRWLHRCRDRGVRVMLAALPRRQLPTLPMPPQRVSGEKTPWPAPARPRLRTSRARHAPPQQQRLQALARGQSTRSEQWLLCPRTCVLTRAKRTKVPSARHQEWRRLMTGQPPTQLPALLGAPAHYRTRELPVCAATLRQQLRHHDHRQRPRSKLVRVLTRQSRARTTRERDRCGHE